MSIYFAKGENSPRVYSDFWKLVELSGYPVVSYGEMDIDDPVKTYFVTYLDYGQPDHIDVTWLSARAQIIHLDYEWRDFPSIMKGIRRTWVADKWYADLHKESKFEYIPLGSHPGLNDNPNGTMEKLWDYAHMMNTAHSARRAHILVSLMRQGITIAPNGWDYARHVALLQSRAMLHVHAREEWPVITPLRWCLAAAYKLPMYCEKVTDAGKFQHGVMGLYVSYATMNQDTYSLKPHPTKDSYIGEALHEYLCHDYTFKRMIETNV